MIRAEGTPGWRGRWTGFAATQRLAADGYARPFRRIFRSGRSIWQWKQVLLRNVLYISRKLKLSLVGSWVASVGHSATNSGECRLGGDLRGMGGRWRVWAERNFRRCL